MPKLDGVSATSLIRQFDHMTPIISMTSNSKPAEIMKYYSSGMNDHLPKPFTKDGLWDVLDKHLTHLKVIQTLSRVPRSVGVPPLSDPSFDNALAVHAYPSLRRIVSVPAHQGPIGHACLSPDGTSVFTICPYEEAMKMWRVWGPAEKAERRESVFDKCTIR